MSVEKTGARAGVEVAKTGFPKSNNSTAVNRAYLISFLSLDDFIFRYNYFIRVKLIAFYLLITLV